jgi:hypothetical protein
MGRLDRSTQHDAASGPPANRSAKPTTTAELAWSCLVVGVPLGAGLVINAALGWWPGLVAFLISALLIGAVACRRD